MATKKGMGCGTTLGLDEANGSNYTDVSQISELTLPTKERNQVEAIELSDCSNDTLPGGEAPSTFSFLQFWEPGDTDHERIDALFDSKATAAFQATATHDYLLSGPTVQWNGWIQTITPETLNANGLWSRTVAGVRTGTVTHTPGADA